MSDLLPAPEGLRCAWLRDGAVIIRRVVCLQAGRRREGVEPIVITGERLLPAVGDFLILLGHEPDPTPADFDNPDLEDDPDGED